MGQIDNVQNIAFSTSFNMDKLYYGGYEGSFSAAGKGTDSYKLTTYTFSHDKGGETLPVMQWSLDNSAWLDASTNLYGADPLTDPSYSCTCAIDSSTVYMYFYNESASAQTVYYRLVFLSES